MFPKNLVFSVSVGVAALLGVTLEGCTRNFAKMREPQAPVAEPTAITTPPAELSQGPRNESEPVIPFDGSRPEVLVVPQPPKQESIETAKQQRDIYVELTGQSLKCEEARP
jgi:hypothetical protein